jgi:hypothetical protein
MFGRLRVLRRLTGTEEPPADLRRSEFGYFEPNGVLYFGVGDGGGDLAAEGRVMLRHTGTRLWHDILGAADGSTQFVGDGAGLTGVVAGSVAWGDVTGKPSFATVATSGAYADLTGLPTLGGAAALNVGTTAGTVAAGNDARLSDAREWTATTVSQAEAEAGTATTRRAFTAQRVRQAAVGWWNGSADKTKLDGIATGATANATDAALRDRATHTGTQAWATITTTPTTLAGYGITDAAPLSHVGAGGGAHALATTSVAGFMAAADKTRLAALGTVWATSAQPSANVINLTTGAGLTPVAGLQVRFRAGTATTGAATINLDSSGAVDARTITNVALPNGYVRTDADTVATFDGTNWILDRAPERGSNANGEWTRYADGRQEVVSVTSSNVDVSTATGQIFTSADLSITFPASFFSAATTVGWVTPGNAVNFWGVLRPTGATAGTVRLFSSASVTGRNYRFSAVGRWY